VKKPSNSAPLKQKNKVTFTAKDRAISIDVVFTEDEYMKELNAQFRGERDSTDVLAFYVGEEINRGAFFLGEIVVNLTCARKQAKEYKIPLVEEIARLVAHGALHLLGKGDSTFEERRDMSRIQEEIVRDFQKKSG
jgi:probable rRNA maturation factor